MINCMFQNHDSIWQSHWGWECWRRIEAGFLPVQKKSPGVFIQNLDLFPLSASELGLKRRVLKIKCMCVFVCVFTFVCVCGCVGVCTLICVQMPRKAGGVCLIPWSWSYRHCGCQNTDSSSLKEQQVMLTIESSPQLPELGFKLDFGRMGFERKTHGWATKWRFCLQRSIS